jgi:hypothetical protein
MSTPEALLKTKIRAYLRDELGAYVFSPVQMGMGESTLDILCCIKGKFVGIEVKTPGKKPTPRQISTITRIIEASGMAFWTDSLDYTKEMLRAGGFVLP